MRNGVRRNDDEIKKQTAPRDRKNKEMFYLELPTRALDKLAEPFDGEFVPSKPLTPAMRARASGPSQARTARCGKGSEKVLISVERRLPHRTDAYAKKQHKNRSRAVLFPEKKRRAS